jgi:ABC-type phosphate transport system permease subunit
LECLIRSNKSLTKIFKIKGRNNNNNNNNNNNKKKKKKKKKKVVVVVVVAAASVAVVVVVTISISLIYTFKAESLETIEHNTRGHKLIIFK